MNALPSDERVAVTREISRNPVLYQIGVVGGGTMGRGIMQLFLQAGHEVRCHDAAAGAAEKAIEHVRVIRGHDGPCGRE